MATTRLPADFRDFLKLLNSRQVEYLLKVFIAAGMLMAVIISYVIVRFKKPNWTLPRVVLA
jgi:hypothetical protein